MANLQIAARNIPACSRNGEAERTAQPTGRSLGKRPRPSWAITITDLDDFKRCLIRTSKRLQLMLGTKASSRSIEALAFGA